MAKKNVSETPTKANEVNSTQKFAFRQLLGVNVTNARVTQEEVRNFLSGLYGETLTKEEVRKTLVERGAEVVSAGSQKKDFDSLLTKILDNATVVANESDNDEPSPLRVGNMAEVIIRPANNGFAQAAKKAGIGYHNEGWVIPFNHSSVSAAKLAAATVAASLKQEDVNVTVR